jgi:hypothetical protein
MQPDPAKIGSARYTSDPKDDSSTWADLARENDKVSYLLRGWLPYRMLTGIIGQPKAGKSAWVLWAVVRPIITGCHWFTGQIGAEPGYVVWADTEHRAAINLERAAKWGLPVERIIVPFRDRRQVFHLDDEAHRKRLLEVVCRYEAKAVILDSYRGAHCRDENNSTIGVGLQALGGLCEETGTACLVIHHAKKMSVGEDMTINCGRGSNAFLAAVACQTAIDVPDPTPDLKRAWRRVQVLGENLGIAPRPVGYRFTDAGLEFGPAPTRPQQEKKETGKDRAEDWLQVRMQPGNVYPAAEIIEEAKALGFPHTGTLQRAKAALQVQTVKQGKHHYWRRPALDKDDIKISPEREGIREGSGDG